MEIFVSPSGENTNPGTYAKPLFTLKHAQLVARQGTSARITLLPGTHYLSDTLVLTEADSGTVWQAARRGEAIVSGGVRLNLTWEPFRNGIWRAKTPENLVLDQIFVNGERQHMARYPNFDPNVRHFNGYAADAFSPERAKRWADPRGAFLHAMHLHEWGDFHYRVTGKNPDSTLVYEGGWQNNRRLGMHGTYRMVENVFEELDAPGEWFHDTKSATLYFYPTSRTDLSRAVIEAVRLRHLVELRGARNLTLRDLTFRHAARTFMDNKEPLLRSDWTTYRGGAILLEGTENCLLEGVTLDQVGGNAIFISGKNRHTIVRSCHIVKAGGNGVAFVGEAKAVRSPLFEYEERQTLGQLDFTPGPKTDDFPTDCLVEDCLIHETGRVEKQTSPVQIAMARRITVRHCSLYDVPRAGINIGDGCWGGHVIEHCDVFNTVLETGDHGSFNSWGRDRYWGLKDVDLNTITRGAQKNLPLLDVVEPIILRNNRWRCDHGWDIDLDDGSSHYELRNNLCLNGGIKHREGFYRVCENNVMVSNSFHPHVWYVGSRDVFRKNIVFMPYQPIQVPLPWGEECDNNLWHVPGKADLSPAETLQKQSGRDAHSLCADARFVAPERGDYRVKQGSPALALGFKNFPMDRFGVRSGWLKAMAKTPILPPATQISIEAHTRGAQPIKWLGAICRNIVGLGEVSAFGLPGETGVLLLDIAPTSPLARVGLQKNDVIVGVGATTVSSVTDLPSNQPMGQRVTFYRNQRRLTSENLSRTAGKG